MRSGMEFLLIGLLGSFSLPIDAMGQDLIFDASFESDEGCVVFNALNQAVVIPTIEVSGNLTLNGGEFPADDYDDAVFSLRDLETGAVFPIGNSHDGNYSVNIIPGQYDLLYDMESTSSNPEAPQNRGAILTAAVPLFTTQTLDIDVTSYKIGGDFLLNNGPFPVSEYEDANFHLDSEINGQVFLGNSHDQAYLNVPVLPGSYQVRYAVETKQGADVPANTWGYITDINVSGANGNLDLDVTSIDLGGDFLHNGVAFPVLDYDDGTFWLETDHGDRAFLGNSHDLTFDTQVIPGTYDVFWELETLGPTVPFNKRARVTHNVDVNGPTLDVNVVSWHVQGDFLLNGGPFPNLEPQTGRILLRDKASGVDDNELGKTFAGSFDRRVVQGSYAVVYQHLEGSEVPQNKFHTLGSAFLVNKDRVVDFDVPASVFTASAFHNGALFPNSVQQQGRILLSDPESGDLVLLGDTSEQNFSELIIPGTFDVYYSHLSGADVPANFRARIARDLVIPAGGDTEFHVTSFVYPGTFYRNDVATPALEGDDAIVVLRRGIDEALLGNTHDQGFTIRLIYDPNEDLFQIFYQAETVGPSMPANADTRLVCAKVVMPLI